MNHTDVSRRQFALIAGSLAATQVPAYGFAGAPAGEVIRQIQASLGGEWPETGLDGVKAGDPTAPVKGIATTAMATMSVLQQASKAGLNLVITHEPTFYGARDGIAAPPPPPSAANAGRGRGRGPVGITPDDPVYRAKKEFIEKNNMVVFRLRDHWHDRKEMEMATGLAEALGWSGHKIANPDGTDGMFFDIPSASLEETVAGIRKKLNMRGGLRAVGDRKAKIRRVRLHPGLMAVATMWKNFDKTDLLIAGEVREWECTHYAFDMISAGEKHALVTLGRVVSEEPGMRLCANWLKSQIKGVPVQWISAGDPYWRAV